MSSTIHTPPPERSRSLTEWERTLLKSPPLRRHFPLTISAKHKTVITAIDSYCGECGKLVDASKVHGVVNEVLENVVTVEGVALCYDCRLLTPINLRFRTTDRETLLETQTPQGWTRGVFATHDKWLRRYRKAVWYWRQLAKYLWLRG